MFVIKSGVDYLWKPQLTEMYVLKMLRKKGSSLLYFSKEFLSIEIAYASSLGLFVRLTISKQSLTRLNKKADIFRLKALPEINIKIFSSSLPNIDNL